MNKDLKEQLGLIYNTLGEGQGLLELNDFEDYEERTEEFERGFGALEKVEAYIKELDENGLSCIRDYPRYRSKKYIADVSSVYGVSEHDKKYLNNCSDNETKLWLIEQVMNGNIILIECSAEDEEVTS